MHLFTGYWPRRRKIACATVALLALLLLFSPAAPCQAPAVSKLEPPNWFPGAGNVMLLVYGEGLAGAQISTTTSGVHITQAEASPQGNYAFVWLEFGKGASPSDVEFLLKTHAGSTTFNLPLTPRHSRDGAFRGLDANDVLYLIMPDRFADGSPANDQPPQSPGTFDRKAPRAYHGGDLKGVRDHLPYLHELGVTALWITPVYDNDNHSPADYHGYAAVNFYAVDEHLGTLGDLQELVKEAHKHGMKVFLDCVVNHTGPKHPWIEAPPTPTWLHGTPQRHLATTTPIDPAVDEHAPPRDWRPILEGWFDDRLPDLNQEDPRVAEYLIGNAIWWAEHVGIDGFRLDTFPYVYRGFWATFHKRLTQLYPAMDTIGEIFDSAPTVVAHFVGGRTVEGVDTGLPTVFDFPLYSAIKDVVAHDAPARRLKEVLQQDWLYPHPERLVTFIGNHDTTRFVSEAAGSKEKLKLAQALLLTMRGIPQLYSGDEIGMAGGADPDNRRDFPGGFPGDSHNAFSAQGRTPEEQDVFSYVQALLKLRRQHPAITAGKHWHLYADDSAYIFLREVGADRVLVAFNNSESQRKAAFRAADTPVSSARRFELIFGVSGTAGFNDGQVEIEMPPRSVTIYQGR